MSGFQPGDIVDITIKGARVRQLGTEGHGGDVTPIVQLNITEDDGRLYYVALPLPSHWKSVAIERAAPPEWPPREGDVWRDDAEELWFASTDEMVDHGEVLTMVPADRVKLHSAAPNFLLAKRGPLTLAYREVAP